MTRIPDENKSRKVQYGGLAGKATVLDVVASLQVTVDHESNGPQLQFKDVI